ncbi:helix-turn-helix transcriptional regulator [Acinetobacter bereziniae]|uniref:helix-turn-helix domain-containing protein n=1 Tax=Acinetobacter bereziniae TaxID=106648 RepID=UPI0005A90768|nr:AraC family transcriptional regulator [Acinetobacter bereziniae]MBI0395963.1 helix-turn-helix transcriptional regulator [Acinetobacter bereziniae]MDV8156413.1 AraC family transcriptional regulator [Acinetobacter bereziniae]
MNLNDQFNKAITFVKKSDVSSKYWLGKISIGYGIGYFEGNVGDNDLHRHHAHQLSFAKNAGECIQVSGEEQCIFSSGVYITANTLHHLKSGTYCSIYIDQTHFLASVIHQYLQPISTMTVLPEDLVIVLRKYFIQQRHHDKAFQMLLNYCGINHFKQPTIREQHLSNFLSSSKQQDLTLKQIAEQFNLSESRFSHWFSESFGISYRSYRKWLRLLQTIQSTSQQTTLTNAAYQSHFSDQAHFSRTCKQMFGIQPSLLKFIPSIEQIPMWQPSDPILE